MALPGLGQSMLCGGVRPVACGCFLLLLVVLLVAPGDPVAP